MKSGRGEIKGQIGGTGAFARVFIDVSTGEHGCTIQFADGFASGGYGEYFGDAIRAGVKYAHEALMRADKSPDSIVCTVTKLLATAADSSTILVFYAAALAFWDAVEVTLTQIPEIVVDNGRFIRFPL
jgi:hypothetical protein